MTYKSTEMGALIGDQDKECSVDLWWAEQEMRTGSFSHFNHFDYKSCGPQVQTYVRKTFTGPSWSYKIKSNLNT